MPARPVDSAAWVLPATPSAIRCWDQHPGNTPLQLRLHSSFGYIGWRAFQHRVEAEHTIGWSIGSSVSRSFSRSFSFGKLLRVVSPSRSVSRSFSFGSCQLWEDCQLRVDWQLWETAQQHLQHCQLWETAVAKDPRNETKCTCLEFAQRQLERPREKVSAEGRELAGEKSNPEVAT